MRKRVLGVNVLIWMYMCGGSDKDKLMKLLGTISEKAVPMVCLPIEPRWG